MPPPPPDEDAAAWKKSFYVPKYENASCKFRDLQLQRIDYNVKPTPAISSPIDKLLEMDEEELDLAVLKNDLVLSDAAVKRAVEYAAKVASKQRYIARVARWGVVTFQIAWSHGSKSVRGGGASTSHYLRIRK